VKKDRIDLVKIFIYVSVGFLIWTLYSRGYAEIPHVYHPVYLVFSMVMLVAAFAVEAVSWRRLASPEGVTVSLTDSFASIGVSIFGKYIPGKFWAVIGRAAYLSQGYGIPASDINIRSLTAQMLVIWSGLIVGGVSMFLIKPSFAMAAAISVVGIAISVLLFTNGINRILMWIGSRFRIAFRSLPTITFHQLAPLIPVYFLQWILWCLAFYLFVYALSAEPVPLASGLSFALAAVIGILAFVSPGGLGVREGIMAASLVACGIESTNATSISIASRLWFLCGECCVFMMAAILSHNRLVNEYGK
jgi:uncharacterized membrane protein YbhN (UPF0104 family)